MLKEWFLPYFNDKNGQYVEIGPLDNPFLKKCDYPSVKYADIRNKQAISDEYINKKTHYNDICEIDYVISGTYSECIGENRIDGFFSSHMIEHCSDILSHFNGIYKCLKEGAVYGFVMPDKRFGQDRYRAVTSFRDAYDVYRNGDTKRFALDNAMHFSGGDYFFPIIANNQVAIENYDTVNSNSGIFHTWVFDYAAFLEFLRDALSTKTLPFTLVGSHSPEEQKGSADFSIILRKDSGILEDGERLSNEVYRIQSIYDDYCGRKNMIPEDMKNREIYIYGAGTVGKAFYKYARYRRMPIAGFVVSDGESPDTKFIEGLDVFFLSELLSKKDDIIFLIAVVNCYDIVEQLENNSCAFMRLCQ